MTNVVLIEGAHAMHDRYWQGVGPRRVGPIAQLGFILLAVVGCANEDIKESVTEPSALTTRLKNGDFQFNVARNGTTASSGAYVYTAAWTINDGNRGSPFTPILGQGAYWASNTSSANHCNSGNWWVRVSFGPAPGTVCTWDGLSPPGSCVRNISEIDLFSLQDNPITPTDPTTSTVTTLFGNVSFRLQYCPQYKTCYASGANWVTPSGGYITGNNKAWKSVSFAPVNATAVRASIDCAQNIHAYVVELEAWETQPAGVLAPQYCTGRNHPEFVPIPRDDLDAYVGDDNSTASILTDTDRFWWTWFGKNYADGRNVAGTPRDNGGEISDINYYLSSNQEQWQRFAQRAAALVKMYDRLAPIDFPRAMVYLDRLRVMANAFLANRDDKRMPLAPPDFFHGNVVMPAWGGFDRDLDGRWTTGLYFAGLLSYPMAAYARRVAEHPNWFCDQDRDDAIKFTTAVMETYLAFRQDMRFSDTTDSTWGYYTFPSSFGGLVCPYTDTEYTCHNLRDSAGKPITWNHGLSFLRSLAEVAIAADSELYRTSSDFANATPEFVLGIGVATRLVAKNIKAFVDQIDPKKRSDNTSCSGEPDCWNYWRYRPDDAIANRTEDTGHGNLDLENLVTVWEDRGAIDGILARYGFSESITLTSTHIARFANTFLLKIWYYDYSVGSTFRNLLFYLIDGTNGDIPTPTPNLDFHRNEVCGGWVGITPTTAANNPWVWVRCRDSTFNQDITSLPGCDNGPSCNDYPALNVENHAALIRYRP